MYENLTRYELESRLSFYENNSKYVAAELAKAKKKIAELTELNKEFKVELDRITEMYKMAVDRLFGKKSEKVTIVPDGQISMFTESENEVIIDPPKKRVKEHYRAPKRTFEQIYGNLPTEEKYYELSDEEKICTRCGLKMHEFGYETHTEIDHQPAVFSVLKIHRQKCVCKCCEQHMDENGEEHPVFAVAKCGRPLIRGSMVSPSLAAHEINAKICLRLPLYCIEQEYKRNGIDRSRQTMCNNMLALADMLDPLYEAMHKELIRLKIIHADETHWQTNHVKGKNKPVKGYFWVYHSGRYEEKKIVLYNHQNGRSAEYPKKFLEGFSGYGHCDGYGAYNDVPDLIRVGCWAHLRRYFLNAVKVQGDKTDLTTAAGQGFLMINEIFHAEKLDPEKPHEKSELTLEEIACIRRQKSAGLLERFFEWCVKKNEGYLPSELTRRAIKYALNQRESLSRFLEDPRLELTNNAAERAVRPVAVGRKNWLFSNSERGAKALSVLFSVVETAKANALKPYEYLKHIFETMRSGESFEWAEILPWSGNLPGYVRI